MSLDHFNAFHVLPGKIIVAPDADENRSKGGIWYPDVEVKKAQTGLVLQHAVVYSDEDFEGKHILFEKWVWTELVLRGVKLYIIDERSVFAVIEREEGNNPQKTESAEWQRETN